MESVRSQKRPCSLWKRSFSRMAVQCERDSETVQGWREEDDEEDDEDGV